jgi:DnaJ-class molecular chaperone
MKRINEYRKLFDVTANADLKELKTVYRNLVKEWHPDKFQDGDEKAAEAALKSKQIIEGYHFLVSIAPETKANNLEEYNATISDAHITDFKHKGLLLEVNFSDGNTYEYFGVNAALFSKFLNAEKQLRFAKRNIFNSFLYRKSKRTMEMA